VRAPRGATVEELETLYRGGFQAFLRVATAVAGEQEAGRDAVQSAFVSAVRNRRSFRREGSLEGWLWTIVIREARRSAPLAHQTLDEAAALATTNGAGGSDPYGVRPFIASLPPRQREAVFLRYFADLDYRTIARVLDVEPGTVSATLSSAHQTLRERLEARTR
jgi:DNA-directed RNA polymerase specialized sigma24 family protein